MAKGQQKSSKEAKKPKKDATNKPVTSSVAQPVKQTAIIPRGKLKPT